MHRVSARRTQPIEPQSDDFDFLLSHESFRVPRYQRAFDWDTEEVRDFASDILTLARRRVAGSRSRHFFGAIISIFHKSDRYYEVVDGQQRLTTAVLCLSELGHRWQELATKAKASGKAGVADAASAHADRVQGLLQDESGRRLILSKRDDQFFSELLADTAAKPASAAEQSHRRLWSAREALHSTLFSPLLESTHRLADRQTRLEALEDALLQDGYLVHLYTEEKREAYRLFLVLNDRGRQLSDGSLLRTHTLDVLQEYPQEQRAAETDWDSILRTGDNFVNRFLAAYYVSYVGSRAPMGDMFDAFCERFAIGDVDSPTAAINLHQTIRRLLEETETFSRIRAGDWPYDNPAKPGWDRDRLKRLVISLRHDLAHPLLLAVARETNESTFRDLVLLLEPFVFRYINVTNAGAARLAVVYYEHARKVRQTRRLDKKGLRDELKALIANYAPDDVFKPLLRDQLRYAKAAQRRQLIKHFLTTIEDYEAWFDAGAKGKRKVTSKASVYDLGQVNIEHVYPQNPKKASAKLEEVKHGLGNLTALDERDGILAGNEEFTAKRDTYNRSKFVITQPLASLQRWTEAEVASRFEFYAARAMKIFTVE
jgi:Protein of unknown function DUF262/Protein of unknown function (DUF1524)